MDVASGGELLSGAGTVLFAASSNTSPRLVALGSAVSVEEALASTVVASTVAASTVVARSFFV